MTCIKCQLSSSLFFLRLTLTFQWESNFNGSLNIGGVREKLNIVCALDAMVSKLISLICFDIFRSKWYRNALIGVWTIKPTRKKGCFGKHYMFDWKMSKQIKDISFSAVTYFIASFWCAIYPLEIGEIKTSLNGRKVKARSMYKACNLRVQTMTLKGTTWEMTCLTFAWILPRTTSHAFIAKFYVEMIRLKELYSYQHNS